MVFNGSVLEGYRFQTLLLLWDDRATLVMRNRMFGLWRSLRMILAFRLLRAGYDSAPALLFLYHSLTWAIGGPNKLIIFLLLDYCLFLMWHPIMIVDESANYISTEYLGKLLGWWIIDFNLFSLGLWWLGIFFLCNFCHNATLIRFNYCDVLIFELTPLMF